MSRVLVDSDSMNKCIMCGEEIVSLASIKIKFLKQKTEVFIPICRDCEIFDNKETFQKYTKIFQVVLGSVVEENLDDKKKKEKLPGFIRSAIKKYVKGMKDHNFSGYQPKQKFVDLGNLLKPPKGGSVKTLNQMRKDKGFPPLPPPNITR